MLNILKRFFIVIFLPGLFSCSNSKVETPRELSNEFKEYWFDGTADISSYHLEQVRYGQIRDGHAVLIFVTEPFSPSRQVKIDDPSGEGINVLKLNFIRKFTTGIYPYSIMMSTFSPLKYYGKSGMIKETFTSQEWCGQVFTQINQREEGFVLNSYSYFEKEGDVVKVLPQVFTEDEIWSRIKLNPRELPVGQLNILPGVMASRLKHFPLEPGYATANLKDLDSLYVYSVEFDNERMLEITFRQDFPYSIEGWVEKDGEQQTTARRMKTLKLPYWQLNSNRDQIWRDSLDLQ